MKHSRVKIYTAKFPVTDQALRPSYDERGVKIRAPPYTYIEKYMFATSSGV